uniref:DnaJ homolog subfamily C member 30, mitochondrial n=1 Tax=Geotrypetes seraphini TaxID=260995 RepID=A0A6P8P471_GEOSA|nr:dnaJ homolog subfamily C member 30, mitochondrial [Geotrypetes seraphini]
MVEVGRRLAASPLSLLNCGPLSASQLFADGARKGESGGGARAYANASTPRAYYEILGVSGSATQAQIKSAYYQQSFACHPDRNAGDERAAERFSRISEAYLVLGSVALRKRYDRGLLSPEDVRRAVKPSREAEPEPRRTRTAASLRRDPAKALFNFDDFYRAHYGEQLERERSMKRRRDELRKLKSQRLEKWERLHLTEVSAALLLLAATCLLVKLGSSA